MTPAKDPHDLAGTGASDAAWEALRGRRLDHLVREDVPMTGAQIAAETFGRLGFDIALVTEREVELDPEGILFVAGNTLSYKRTLRRLAALPAAERPVTIVWHTEPLPMPRSCGVRREPPTLREVAKIVLRDRRTNDHFSNARYLRALAREDAVDAFVVAAKAYQAYLAEVGVAAEHVPLGYHPSQGRLLAMERDVDVLFLGAFRVRRRRRILRQLSRSGLEILKLGDYSDPQLWGESRTKLLNRTKVMLHIPRLEGHCSDIRMNITMATGALLISEPLCLPDPFVPGVHYVESRKEDLADTVRHYLADDEARRRITEVAHRFITTELPLEQSYERLLTLAAEGLARRAP